MGAGRKVYRVLMGKLEGKRPLGRPRRRWEDGIRTDLREIGWLGVWSGFVWFRTGAGLGCCECGDEPSVSGATELVNSTWRTVVIMKQIILKFSPPACYIFPLGFHFTPEHTMYAFL
jgi:hypothetical protein